MKIENKTLMLSKSSAIKSQLELTNRSLAQNFLSFLPKGIQNKVSSNETIRSSYRSISRRYRFLKGIIKPYKSPRVFVKKGLERIEFFQILNERKIEYVLLRWWEDLPSIPEGEDMDILIRDSHRFLIQDLLTFGDNGTGLKCDIYTVTGSNYGSHKSLPYFQYNLSQDLLKGRILFRGAYVPSKANYFASLAYHALFHKGLSSGIPGFKTITQGEEHDYPTVLKNLAIDLNLDLEITVKGIFRWLKKNEYAPAEDTLAKLVDIKPELSLLLKKIYSDRRGGELMVYVIREKLLEDNLLGEFKKFLETKFNFEILDIRLLNAGEKDICSKYIRGGKWDQGPYKYSGGRPEALLVAYDYHPEALNEMDLKKQSRMTNKNNLLAKYKFREHINQLSIKRSHYNGIHSADNEFDAKYYLFLLGKDYLRTILKKTEKLRDRYHTKYSVVKLISNSHLSKVELIKYKTDIAIKKTFRLGREKFFQRELFATQELSKELSFIPRLLERGEGYLILPFIIDKSKNLTPIERERMISSKARDIVAVIGSFHSRGYYFLNFNPASLLISNYNKFYCTGYSYLQKYLEKPRDLCKAFEVDGIPKDFKGDLPSNYGEDVNFSNVWENYIGPWEQQVKVIK